MTTTAKAHARQQANAREAARKRGAAATQHGPHYRAGEHFDWDRAIELLRATLREVYR